MNRRTRTRLCMWLILLGLANFLGYTVVYAYIQGDATNGRIEAGKYYVSGHHLYGTQGRMTEVSRWVWIYSYGHSISIWPTIACVLLAMLTLSRPLILATYDEGSLMRGSTLVGVIGTLIVVVCGLLTVFFTIDFVRSLMAHS